MRQMGGLGGGGGSPFNELDDLEGDAVRYQFNSFGFLFLTFFSIFRMTRIVMMVIYLIWKVQPERLAVTPVKRRMKRPRWFQSALLYTAVNSC